MSTFAEAVGTAQTPEHRGATQATPESALGQGAEASDPRGRVRRYQPTCPVCAYRSRGGLTAMATHTAGGADGDGASPVCPGAQMFSTTYAGALDMQASQGPRLLEIDLLGDGVENIPADSGSPAPDDMSPMSRAPSPSMATSAPLHNPPSVLECAAPLQDIYARLWQSTDPADLGGLVTVCASAIDPRANPDESEPDDHPTDTDAAAASCAMGEEHVLAIIEHIISTCTPVAEAHSLLHILQGVGTVPWKTLEPYLKVLRQWHSECGRHSVQSQDLRIKVRASPC